MNITKSFYYLLMLCITAGTIISCNTGEEGSEAESNAAGIVNVSAKDFKFEAPDSIASGWNTFRFTNEGAQEHFFYIYQLPDTMSYQQFLDEAMVPFGTVWGRYASGETDRATAEQEFAEELPAWFFTDLVPSGGPALTEPGETSQTTVNLTPGLYVVECYVKAPDGSWHTELGMQQTIRVTDDETGRQAPEADAELTLTNYNIESEGTLEAGTQTIAVHVEENPEGFMMHDINLFRLDDSTSTDDIVQWMDWMDKEQFRAPAPAYSLGGVEHMAAGKTGYMTVDLTPGRYAWISEGYGSRGMVKTFTIE